MYIINVTGMKEVIDGLKEYIVPLLNINFINRRHETEQLLNIIRRLGTKPWIHVITGPWGCGKSEWARALVFALNKLDKCNAVYLNLTEKEIDKFYATTKREIVEFVEEIVKHFLGNRMKITWYVYRIAREIYSKMKIRGGSFIIVFDEITYAIGRNRYEIEAFVNSLGRKLIDIAREFSCITHAVIITSDQLTSKYFTLLSGKLLSNYIMWNLDKNSFHILIESLKAPYSVDKLWRILGGNPRALIDLWLKYEWNLTEYIGEQIDKIGTSIREKAIEVSTQRNITYNEAINLIFNELDRVLKDINELDTTVLWSKLLEENIAIYVDRRFYKLSELPSCEWISKRCAFQLPIYYWILKVIAKYKTLNITVDSVLRNLL